MNLRVLECGVSRGTPVSSPPSSVRLMVSVIEIKLNKMRLQFCRTKWLSCPFILRRTRHIASDKRQICCTRCAIDCARATSAYIMETVRGAVRRLHNKQTNASTALFDFILILIIIIIIIITIFMISSAQDLVTANCDRKMTSRFISQLHRDRRHYFLDSCRQNGL